MSENQRDLTPEEREALRKYQSTLRAVEIVTDSRPAISAPKEISGWGDDGHMTKIHGHVQQLTITRGGAPQFGIRINDDGSIVLTEYAGLFFQTNVPQNVKFTPARPWTNE